MPLIILAFINCLAVITVKKIQLKFSFIPHEYTAPVLGLDSHGHSFKRVETFGDTTTINPKVLLLGDSHALAMKNYLNYLGKKNSFSFRTVTNDAYPTVPGIPKEDFTVNRDVSYKIYSRLIDQVEKELKTNDIIILSYYFSGGTWTQYIEDLIKKLNQNQQFILVSDFPTLDKNPIRINRGITKNKNRKDNVYKIIPPKVPNDLIEFMNSRPNCHYLDLSKSRAFANIPFYKDTIMYYDEGHLNFYGEKVYAKDTEEKFMNLFRSLTIQLKKN